MNVERGVHLRRYATGVVVSPNDGRNVVGRQADCAGEVVVVAENAVGRIESDPACSGEIGFRPCVQRAFRALLLRLELAQVAACKPRGDAVRADL